MIQTIVLLEQGKYPFGQVQSHKKLVKVQDIRSYPSAQQLKQQKAKVQNLYSSNDKFSQTTTSDTENIHFIKLLKIYQEDLNLHFIYQYVPYSLDSYIHKKVYANIQMQKSHILQMNSKLFLKKVNYELGSIINFLIRNRIKIDLQYELLGVDDDENLKFFLDPEFQIAIEENKTIDETSSQNKRSFSPKEVQNQLHTFYQFRRGQIMSQLQSQFAFQKKKQKYSPNFVIQGNQLIFCKPINEAQSEGYSPCPSSFSESNFTERCESVNNNFLNNENTQNTQIRKTHGNLFTKLKKSESYNYNTETNKKLQQNMKKLQHLKEKSKRLNEQLKQSYLSNKKLGVSSRKKIQTSPLKRETKGNLQDIPTQNSHVFSKKKQDEPWRSSQIPSNLRKTHLPKGPSAKSPNRIGMNFDQKRSKSSKNHKSSFQFKPKQKNREWFNPNRSFDNQHEEDIDESFQQTKSIRIQLQQSTKNKQRKNSYKVKILTCHEMELDGENIEQFLFNTMNKNFENNKNEEEQEHEQESCSNQSEYSKTSNKSRSSKYSNRYENMFSQKFKEERHQDANSKFSQSPVKHHIREKQRENSNQKNIFQKYYEQFRNNGEKGAKNQKLEEKIKLAKQKAESVLNKYMKTKKYANKCSSSKLIP